MVAARAFRFAVQAVPRDGAQWLLAILRGSPREMAGELERPPESIGLSYVSVNAAFAEAFAPVAELLAGH